LEVAYTDKAKEDIVWWKASGNNKVMKKIAALVEELRITPKEGTGKPEALKYGLAGRWSRRITREDRIIYTIEEARIVIHSLKGHYD